MLCNNQQKVMKLLMITLLTLFVTAISSCESPKPSVVDTTENTESKNLVEVVNRFLELTKDKKNKEAMLLFTSYSKNIPYENSDQAPEFDWASFFSNRNLISKGVKQVNVKGDEGVVIMKLGNEDNYSMDGEFSLKKINAEWKIYQIDFGKEN